jgi:hypothetical protein
MFGSTASSNKAPRVGDEVQVICDVWAFGNYQVVSKGGAYLGMIRKGTYGVVKAVSQVIDVELRNASSGNVHSLFGSKSKGPKFGGGGAYTPEPAHRIRVRASQFWLIFRKSSGAGIPSFKH